MGAIKTATERTGARRPQRSTHNGTGAKRLGMEDMATGTSCAGATIVSTVDLEMGLSGLQFDVSFRMDY
jgi:hypothetical protein